MGKGICVVCMCASTDSNNDGQLTCWYPGHRVGLWLWYFLFFDRFRGNDILPQFTVGRKHAMESGQVYPRAGYQRREASPLVPSNHRVRHGVPGTALFLKYRLLQSTLFTQHHAYSTITVDRPLPKAFTTWIAAAGKRQPGVLDPTGEDIRPKIFLMSSLTVQHNDESRMSLTASRFSQSGFS
jgi:hypothetical protein